MKRYLKASTKAGYNWILRANYNEGYKLSDIYGSYSARKEKAWKDCYKEYLNNVYSENFRIISHNSNFFTIAWDEYGKEPKLHIETGRNSYIVLLNQ